MDTINLQLIKQMLIKLDKAETIEERRELRKITKKHIIENVEKSCNVYVKEIEIHRNGGYGFTIYTINDEYIKFEYIAHNKSCKITYNGKFEVSIKL